MVARFARVFAVLPALGLLVLLAAPKTCAARDVSHRSPVSAGKAEAFLAGACALDVTPTNLPVIVNGGFLYPDR